MKRHTRRLLACAIAALLIGTSPPPARADVFYFGAVNYRLFPCTSQYMPANLATGVVIPSRLLTDSELGIRYTYDSASRVYTLYDAGHSVTFDMRRNTTYDNTQQYNHRAFEAGGVIYLPLDFTARYFDLTYKFISSDYGTILRITYKNLISSDSQFRDSISSLLSLQEPAYREINGLPPAGGGVTPGAPDTPNVPPPQVTLTLEADSAEYLVQALDILDEYGVPAAVFLTKDAMYSDHTLLRRATTTYTIGILGSDSETFYESEESMTEELEAANAILRKATLLQTRLTRGPGDDAMMTPELYAALSGAGYTLSDWTLEPPVNKNRAVTTLLNAITGSGVNNVLRISCTPENLELLESLLQRLLDENTVFLVVG